MSNTKSTNRPQVKVMKEFNISAERVFDAWLDTEMIEQWMMGSDLRDEEVLNLETNPKVGGTFSFVVLRDGEELDHKGTYRVVDRPNRLVFTWGVNEEAGDESVVTIDIEPTEDGCRLTLTHEMDPKWEDYVDRTRDGWTLMLNKLDEVTI